jgi:RNA polymerase sigma-70 factor (ECF subfamily)
MNDPSVQDLPRAPQADQDADLVRRAKAGDYQAFESLVVKYERILYTMARRILGASQDAEDVVQESYLSALEHLREFREEASFSTWISRIATNHALKILRKRRGLATVPLEDRLADRPEDIPQPEFIAPWSEDPAQAARDPRWRQAIDQALMHLDEKYRTVFVLRDLEGHSTEETAEALGISMSNAKVRLLRARLLLREEITRVLGDPARRVDPASHSHEMRRNDELR